MDCVGKDKQCLKFTGNPYVKVHTQKECLVFLELTEKVSSNERERYVRQRTWGGDDVDNAEAPPPKGAKRKKRTAPEDDPKPKKTRGTPKSKPELSPDHVLNKAVRLENAANKAQSDSMSIEQAILENPQWKKLNNEAVLTDLRQAKDLLIVHMKLPFWQGVEAHSSTSSQVYPSPR